MAAGELRGTASHDEGLSTRMSVSKGRREAFDRLVEV